MHSNKVESLNNLTIPNYENLRENFVELISYILESSVNEDNDLSNAINEKRVDMKKND